MITPRNHLVLIKKMDEEEKEEIVNGLVVPKSSKEDSPLAVVMDEGDEDDLVYGSMVAYKRDARLDPIFDGEQQLYLIEESDIIATVK